MFRLKLAYFSATGTTRKVLHAVADGMGLPFEEWDFTLPDSRRQERTAGPEDLCSLARRFMPAGCLPL